MVAAPNLEDTHALGHAGYTLWVFALPQLVAALIEAPIALLSDRFERTRMLRAALWCWSAALALCAAAPKPWVLSLGLSCAGAASGVAQTCAQAALVSARGSSSARAMSRWTAYAAAGDLLAPVFVGAALWAFGSYRAGAFVCAGLLALEAWGTGRAVHDADGEPDLADHETEPREPILAALARPRLWGFLLAAVACGLLDEIVVALTALHLTQDLAASEVLKTASLSLFSLGGLLGAALTERLLSRHSARRILTVTACASCLLLLCLVSTSSALVVNVVLFFLGMACTPHYPLLQAAAYDSVKGRPGLVNAGAQMLVAVDIALPLLVGLVAEHRGLAAALLSLAFQPLTVLCAALCLMRPRRGARERQRGPSRR